MKKLISFCLCLCMIVGIVSGMAESAPIENNANVITRDEIFEKARMLVRSGEAARGFALFELLADRGDAESQNNLGYLYEEGLGVEKSLEKANLYYQMAADQGLASAQYNLALNYYNGAGVEQDYQKAMEYYQLAAAQGHAKSINNIGDMYENAKGVEQDYAKAMEYYQDSLERGYDYALTSIGYVYEHGLGVEPDLEKAVEYYRQAAEKGVENGVNLLNRLIEEGKIEKEYRIIQKAESMIPFRFASKEEGQELLLGNKEYYRYCTPAKLAYLMQKNDATMEEYYAFAKEQVEEWTDEEKDVITRGIKEIEDIFTEEGWKMPPLETIVFIKTTMLEENSTSGYTHGTQIYLGGDSFNTVVAMSTGEEVNGALTYILAHEVFHCLTRCNPDFREEIYKIIGFTVSDKDYELPPSVWELFISNPDVEHHNAWATFIIDGKEIDCYTAFVLSKRFEKEGEMFFDYGITALVPTDGTDVYYTKEQASNFDEVFGKNTDYVIDPEECMADNFSYAVVYGDDGPQGNGYQNPEIIEAIYKILSK